MASANTGVDGHYEARREAAWVAIASAIVLVLLALVSLEEDWELIGLPWWIWLVLAVPSLLLCGDLLLGSLGMGVASTRRGALALLGAIVAGNVAGLVLLIAALVTTSSDRIGGGQLLFTAAIIWLANIAVFGVWFWEVDDGGPVARTNHDRTEAKPDFQFPQDENRELAQPGWYPRIWDYLYVSLTSSSAFSPTDTMPLTLRAKLLVGLESTVSLVIVVLVTARAVNVLK
jgi:hypothetical protein